MQIMVLLSGDGSNLQALIDQQWQYKSYSLGVVAANNANAYGLQRAKSASIPHYYIGDIAAMREQRIIELYHKYHPQLIVLAGFMRILSPTLCHTLPVATINIHPSLLPLHPGLHTHTRVLDAGDKQHGTTVHLVTAKLDAGPIIGQASFAILPADTAATLQQRILTTEHLLYPLLIDCIATGSIDVHNPSPLHYSLNSQQRLQLIPPSI